MPHEKLGLTAGFANLFFRHESGGGQKVAAARAKLAALPA
jgi:hypothetical protein